MDQIKTGSFIKELRKEKGLTQEQLSEIFGVSRRTVSRWETGSNLPDLDILVEMADYFDVELRELLDGERKEKKMDSELKKTVLQVADYSNEQKRKLTKRIHILFIAGLIAGIIYMVFIFTGNSDNCFASMCQGFMFGMMIVGTVTTSRYASKIQEKKLKLLRRLKKQS